MDPVDPVDPFDPLDPLDPDSVSPGAEEEADADGAPDGAEEDAEGSADEHPASATQAATAVNRAVVRRKRWGVRDGTEDSGIGTGRAVRAGGEREWRRPGAGRRHDQRW